MQSPTAMEEYDADNVGGTEDDVRFSSYGTEHPTGTGPFVFDSWERTQSVTLKRNDDYWGEKAKLDEVIIQTISDGNARLQALKNGEIDGYDLVAPGDLEGLKADGFTIEQRPAFNVLYLGMNQTDPALADIKVRQAIAHAIDKEAVISQSLPEGTTAATQFIPEVVAGFSSDVTTYEYDPEKAKALLAEAGQSNLTLQFNYPTGVSRPYMPSPEDTFVALKSAARGRRHHRDAGRATSGARTTWTRSRAPRTTACTCSGGPVTTTTPATSWASSSVARSRSGDSTTRSSSRLSARPRPLPTVDEQAPAYEEINNDRDGLPAGRAAGAPDAVAGLRPRGPGLRVQPGSGRGLERHHHRGIARPRPATGARRVRTAGPPSPPGYSPLPARTVAHPTPAPPGGKD